MNVTNKAQGEGSINIADQTIIATLVQSEFSSPEEEQLIEEFFDQESVISPIQQKYLNSLTSVKSEPILNTKTIESPEEDLEDVPIVYGDTAIMTPEIASTVRTKRARVENVYYEVESGDVIGSIARKFDLRVSTILWENNLSAYSIIRPGDKLTILPMDGITYDVAKGDSLEKIANKYNITKEEILEANKLSEANVLAYGQKLLLPGAVKAPVNYSSSVALTGKTSLSGLQVLKNLITVKTKVPTSKSVAGGKFAWPTVGYRITQYYSWRHQAIDIGNKVGTPLYAVDSGIIEVAGWGRGYGNTIVINHGGGRKTRYGHLSKFYVGVGDRVGKGEAIGAMGNTGWSTGPHLHIEVIINGVKYNPLNYLR